MFVDNSDKNIIYTYMIFSFKGFEMCLKHTVKHTYQIIKAVTGTETNN